MPSYDRWLKNELNAYEQIANSGPQVLQFRTDLQGLLRFGGFAPI